MEICLASGLGSLRPELGWLAALLTYSLHAGLWAGAVALLVRWRSVSFALQHAAWKLALVAPLATTCFALCAPSSFERLLGGVAHAPRVALLSLGEAPRMAELASGTRGSTGLSAADWCRRLLDFSGACLLLGAALGVARFSAASFAQWRGLGLRRRVLDARLLARLEHLVERLALSEVRLTESAEIDCPLVLGAREICIPLATLAALDDAEVDAVLAHELAHVERGDGLWFPLLGVVQASLWFHPVTRLVGAQLRQSAELACDERCLELTGEPLALARALTRFAAQALGVERAVALPTMTRPRSSLAARVARLTGDALRARANTSWQSRTGLAISLTAVALLCLASSVRVAKAQLAPALISAPPAGHSALAVKARSAPARPDAELSARMAELARQAQLLEAELASLSTRSAAQRAGENPAVRVIEVEQELGHVRQMQAFIETSAASGQ